MSLPKAWWTGDPRERFWLESTDRADLGADLRAPLADDSGAENWRYTLFQQANVGDLVFHYDKRRAAITSFSTISGAPTPGPIVWAARGSYARERGAEPAELAGYRMSLHQHRSLSEPVTLEALRAASFSIRALHDQLKARVGGPLYFPFELSGRPIRPLQGYAFKLPAGFVDAFGPLREVAGVISTVPPATAEAGQEVPSRQKIVSVEAVLSGYAARSDSVSDAIAETPQSSRLAYMVYMLEILRASGGSLRSAEVFDRLKKEGYAHATDLTSIQASGESRFAKEVRFARLELVHAGLVRHSEDGVWSLSDIGWATFLTLEGARSVVNRRRHKNGVRALQKPAPGPTTGPIPSVYSASIIRTLDKASWTYVLRYGNTDLWKIGHTQDVMARLLDVNRHLPVEITAVDWRLYAKQAWSDSNTAYGMEQRLFRMLAPYRTQGERVRCARGHLVAVWADCLTSSA